MKTVIGSTALVLFLAATTFCNAQPALKQEPMMMNRGTVVLVDDGSCPTGQIKQVSTEFHRSRHQPLRHRCEKVHSEKQGRGCLSGRPMI